MLFMVAAWETWMDRAPTRAELDRVTVFGRYASFDRIGISLFM
jgi:hypothetical protein